MVSVKTRITVAILCVCRLGVHSQAGFFSVALRRLEGRHPESKQQGSRRENEDR